MSTQQPGTAPIKPEYLLHRPAQPAPDDDAAEGSGNIRRHARDSRDARDEPRKSKAERKAEKKARSGMNTGRRFGKVRDAGVQLCYAIAGGGGCEYGEKCRNNHDVSLYLASQPPELRLPTAEDVKRMSVPLPLESQDESPMEGEGKTERDGGATATEGEAAVKSETRCPLFDELGVCQFGFRCRYLSAHSKLNESGVLTLVTDEDKRARMAVAGAEMNRLNAEAQKALRSKKYALPIMSAYHKEDTKDLAKRATKAPVRVTEGGAVIFGEAEQEGPMEVDDDVVEKRTGDAAPLEAAEDTPDVPMRWTEKKRLQWEGKTYLAPLTTVGNLPFRRLCVSYGADITCGEMGLATSFLSGGKEEWSLVRRHPSERMFGIQIAGSKVPAVVGAAEVIGRELVDKGGGVDFVDLNCGCPIDLVFKSGSGSALLDTPARLARLVAGMSRALGEVPVTIKMRTGVKEGRNTVHKLMPRMLGEGTKGSAGTEGEKGWMGVGAMTLHGRTRQQRYTKLADWEYIKTCVDAVRAREADEDLPRIPIFGNGDCYSGTAYWDTVAASGVDGVMVARGALIKPWIFTEINEHREWDISSRERLEGIRKYAEFGLTHFGTDTAGVNTTRRYLCEALSFQYRYVPLGILEVLPAKMNERPGAFRGRDDLETLLASGDSRDWVRISEMFLGPAPEEWSFVPKHRSNAYESQG
ncbi:tRNA-dihydrouridine(47) synthase [NAD(P)(+)] [Mycena indigotica]|uniref:tRNA-dihydrouridine(47) synthase [NAD(P)(+)] n=1 Tax=Mycena indigotica TaxID=2126181 RepID=A0A8H6W2C7_9AGAR|nr:tRNA-dihydrouridine(47) synthase [NAD(P)(+)] [Mycena indigotica]KAF7296829.1 tRNA-dihydrouridine(47) synthase [NAD(P)(+)] [Mycena indigotica]